LLAAAKGEPRVGELLVGKQLIKEIAVPDRMVNFVVR
jgi:leucyl-tRNA synthetase